MEKYGKKGFVIVGVTSEPRAPTETFIEKTGFKAVVVIEKSNATMRRYGFKGYPSAALVGPDGKVLWTGHPASLREDIIEKNLKGVRLGGGDGKLSLDVDLPEKHRGIALKLSKGRIGAAYKALQNALKKTQGEEQRSIEAAIQTVEDLAAREMAAAEEAIVDYRIHDAIQILKRVKAQLAGMEAAARASEMLKEIKADKSFKNEIEAGRRIADAIKFMQAGKIEKARSKLKSVIEGFLRDTHEARRARALLEKL